MQPELSRLGIEDITDNIFKPSKVRFYTQKLDLKSGFFIEKNIDNVVFADQKAQIHFHINDSDFRGDHTVRSYEILDDKNRVLAFANVPAVELSQNVLSKTRYEAELEFNHDTDSYIEIQDSDTSYINRAIADLRVSIAKKLGSYVTSSALTKKLGSYVTSKAYADQVSALKKEIEHLKKFRRLVLVPVRTVYESYLDKPLSLLSHIDKSVSGGSCDEVLKSFVQLGSQSWLDKYDLSVDSKKIFKKTEYYTQQYKKFSHYEYVGYGAESGGWKAWTSNHYAAGLVWRGVYQALSAKDKQRYSTRNKSDWIKKGSGKDTVYVMHTYKNRFAVCKSIQKVKVYKDATRKRSRQIFDYAECIIKASLKNEYRRLDR